LKKSFSFFRHFTVSAFIVLGHFAAAQVPAVQFYRPYTKAGVSVFEPSKADTVPFSGIKLRVGGNFALDYQALQHSNSATPVFVNNVNINQLKAISNAFDLPGANLNFDAQVDDGVRVNMAAYLSSRYGRYAWFKGGYIQVDKLLMFKSPWVDKLMKSFTIKTGLYEMDYGDQHFRRTDGGNAMYNAFLENYIMDEFSPEIGSEIYYHPKSGIIALVGLSNGQIDPTVALPTQTDTSTGKLNYYAPVIHAKIGFDKQINADFRLRVTGSFYTQKSGDNALFTGDRTGSHYFYVMENTRATQHINAWSGRYNPQFNEEINSFMFNPFVKYKGLEFFGTYEVAQGRMITEPAMRKATQYAAEVIYRFPQKTEDFWIGGRYNSLTTSLPNTTNDITINRATGSLGWYASKNIMMKLEYVNQQYQGFAATDIRSGGRFSGFMFETAIGF
jgi:hypothetical protein